MAYKDILRPELIRGIKKWKNSNGFTTFMLHYTADPTKDPERYGKECLKMKK